MPFERQQSLRGSFPASNSAVVAMDCVAGSNIAEEWSDDMIQTGDIVEEIRIGGSMDSIVSKAPFKNGRNGIQKLLHASSKRGNTLIVVKVRRGSLNTDHELVELQACIVPRETASGGGRRPVYVLRSIHDPNYTVAFVNTTENDCLLIQGTRNIRVENALSKAQLQHGYVDYPWEKKMKESLSIAGSTSLLSFLVFPKATDPTDNNSRFNNLNDTLARANAWFNSALASGVPIVFMNVQAEGVLTKISGESASATVNSGTLSDPSNLANASLYGFEDYHGVDIGVMKTVRLWFTPAAGEFPIEIELFEGDTKLGFTVSRTEEGFIYISAVSEEDDVDLPSTRSYIRELYHEAKRSAHLLVISRLSNEKVLPWMASSSGDIRCFDTVSLSQKLSLHRHALKPIRMHVLMWERQMPASPRPSGHAGVTVEQLMRNITFNDQTGSDIIGEQSFRFTD